MSIKKLKAYTIKTNSYTVTKICFFLQKNRGVIHWIKRKLNRGRALCYFDLFRLADYYLRLAEQQGENQITDILQILTGFGAVKNDI